MLLTFVFVLIMLGLVQYLRRSPAQVAVGGTGVSAFARLAEADGKIVALKIAAEAKKAEALAQAAVVEEIHKILG